jgi:hypothetical protein
VYKYNVDIIVNTPYYYGYGYIIIIVGGVMEYSTSYVEGGARIGTPESMKRLHSTCIHTHTYMGEMICGTLVQFGSYQHIHE